MANSLTTPLLPNGLTDDRSDTALAALATRYSVANLSPITKAILQAKLPNGQYAIPSPTAAGATATSLVATPLSGVSRYQEDQFSVNVDQQINDANRLQGKFFFARVPQFQSQFTFQGINAFQIPGYGGDIEFNNRVFTLADTHVFNSHLINEARFGFSRINAPSTPQEPFTGSQFGITNPLCAGNSQFCGMPTIVVTNAFTIGSTTLADQRSTVETFQFSDMVSWTHGRHFIRMGGEARRYRVNFFFNFYSRGQITFNTFKDLLQGTPALGVLGNGIRDRHYRATDLAFYAQDDYRSADFLTLNFGLRIGCNGGISDKDGYFSDFDPAEFAAIGHACTTVSNCAINNGFHLL